MTISTRTDPKMPSPMRSLTACLGGACALLAVTACGDSAPSQSPEQSSVATSEVTDAEAPRVLIVGGGESHDFEAWFHQADSATLAEAGAEVAYTDEPAEVPDRLEGVDVLYLSNNQPLPDSALRAAILRLPSEGTGLIIGHAASWYNWPDWPEYNRTLVGGGARGHQAYGEFTVEVTEAGHPIMAGVPASFTLEDELYRFERDEEATGITVLATAREAETGTVYPVVWTVDVPEGRIVVNTLGHDGAAHDHPAYRRILQNSLEWASAEGS